MRPRSLRLGRIDAFGARSCSCAGPYGARLADVYALVPPDRYLAETAALEIEAHGGVVVPTEAEADVVARAHVRYLKVDMYMQYWADLIVDWTFTPRGGAPVSDSIHTHGSLTAWTSSSYEYYRAVRECAAEMMVMVLGRLQGLPTGSGG